MVPAVCLHLVTDGVLAPEDRLNIALQGVLVMLLPCWEREGLSEREGDAIP